MAISIDQAAGQGVEEEFDRRVSPAALPPDADQEEHRQQHDLPEEVEEHQVDGQEDPHQAAFQDQQQGHEQRHAALLRPGDQHRDDLQKGGQQHHQQGDAVERQGVTDTEAGNPGGVLVQQPAAPAGIEADEQSRD